MLLCVVYHCCCVLQAHAVLRHLCVGIFFPSKVQLGNQIIVTHTTHKYTTVSYTHLTLPTILLV